MKFYAFTPIDSEDGLIVSLSEDEIAASSERFEDEGYKCTPIEEVHLNCIEIDGKTYTSEQLRMAVIACEELAAAWEVSADDDGEGIDWDDLGNAYDTAKLALTPGLQPYEFDELEASGQ